MSKILIGGDLLPTYINEKEFEENRIEKVFSADFLSLVWQSDFRIVNLEGPCTDSNNKILRSGPYLKASRKSFDGIKKLEIDLVSLANNHIMDYGNEGLFSTIELCKKYKVDYLGAGNDIYDAKKCI